MGLEFALIAETGRSAMQARAGPSPDGYVPSTVRHPIAEAKAPGRRPLRNLEMHRHMVLIGRFSRDRSKPFGTNTGITP